MKVEEQDRDGEAKRGQGELEKTREKAMSLKPHQEQILFELLRRQMQKSVQLLSL